MTKYYNSGRKPSVEVSVKGFDSLLIKLSGYYNEELDDYLRNRSGVFIRRMDRIAGMMFKAMASKSGLNLGENMGRAYPVIGTHMKTPRFLKTRPWKPLDKKYLKRKKRMMTLQPNVYETTNYFQYTGDLRDFLIQNSEKLSKAIGLSEGKKMKVPSDKTDPNFFIFKDAVAYLNSRRDFVPAQGANIGTRGKMYDFRYTEERAAPYAFNKKKGSYVRKSHIIQSNRNIEFDLYNGLYKYAEAVIEGGSTPSPEDYIADVFVNKRRYRAKDGTRGAVRDGDFNPKNSTIGYKLGSTRPVLEPYLRYYMKEVMMKAANRIIKQELNKNGNESG